MNIPQISDRVSPKMQQKPATLNLRSQASAPILKRRLEAGPAAENTGQQETPKKRTVRQLKGHVSLPNMKNRSDLHTVSGSLDLRRPSDKSSIPVPADNKGSSATSASTPQGLPRKRLELRKVRSNWVPDSEVTGGPGFMCTARARQIQPEVYRPRATKRQSRTPSIAEGGLSAKKSENRHQSKPHRILRVMTDSQSKVRKGWQSAARQFMQTKMLQKMGVGIEPPKVDVKRNTQASEYLPRGRIITLKDDSTWFDIPPKFQKGLSVASTQKKVLGDQRRRSGVRDASGKRPGSRYSVLNQVSEEDEDRKVRSSLLPFRDWVVLAQDNTIPFVDEEDDLPTPPATSSPDLPRQSSFSFLTRNTCCPHRPPTPIPDDLSSDSSSTASSDVTITPSNVNAIREMSSKMTSEPDPFTDSPVDGDKDTTLHPDRKGGSQGKGKDTAELSMPKARPEFPSSHENKSLLGPSRFDRNKENIRDRPMAREAQEVRLSSANSSTRLPRGIPPKPSQGLHPASLRGARPTPDIRSSIPLPMTLRRHSVEAMGSPRVTPSGSFPSGIRVVDKPHGPRPKPSDEQQTVSDQEGAATAEKGKDRVSSSSSSISDWDFGDDDATQRPKNVFTGEYRSRTLHKSGERHHGPTLRIAASAEKLIMGPDSPGSTYAVTQRSNPALVHYPDTPTRFSGKRRVETGSSSSPALGPSSSSKKENSSTDNTPIARNYCRSAISLESIPRKVSGGRERAIQRKPVNSPSLSSLYSPSGQDEQEPLVPKVPEKFSIHLKSSKSASPVTPAKSTSQSGEGSVRRNYPTPNTLGSPESVRSFPPRTSSRSQAPELAMQSGPGPAIVDAHASDPTVKQKSDVAPQSISKEPSTQAEHQARLPDSKSTRMLDSFRNMFKHKNTVDKSRGKKEDCETPEPEARAQTPVTAIRLRSEEPKAGSAKGVFKTRARYTRLSDGVSWNKTPRNPKPSDEVSSARPSTSASPPPAPSVQHVEGHTPSFARPTKSTRTKASTLRGPSGGSSDFRVRKAHVMTAPTGSPQRPSRYRAPHAGVSSVQKNIIHLPRSIGSVRSKLSSTPGRSLATGNDTSDITKTLNEIHSCIENLCKRATDENAPSKRERYLRMALSLQYQYTNYNNVGKEVVEIEELANKKRSEKCIAENMLFDHFSQVKAHLDEE